MISIASRQVAHLALNTSIFRLAAISLVPPILALPGPNGSRWQRDGRRYPLEVPPRSSVELRALETRDRRRQVSPCPGCPSAISHFRNSWRLYACQGHGPLPLILGIQHGGSEVRGERDESRFEPSPRTRG